VGGGLVPRNFQEDDLAGFAVGGFYGVDDAGVRRDAAGKIVGVSGFGNLNLYKARLVLQSVSDVTPKEIDYSKTLAVTKEDTAPEQLGLDLLRRALFLVGPLLQRRVQAFFQRKITPAGGEPGA